MPLHVNHDVIKLPGNEDGVVKPNNNNNKIESENEFSREYTRALLGRLHFVILWRFTFPRDKRAVHLTTSKRCDLYFL